MRDAFIERGARRHIAATCCPTERPGPHIQGDVSPCAAAMAWDLVIALSAMHRILTKARGAMAVSGLKKWFRLRHWISLWPKCLTEPMPRMVAVENPVGIISTRFHKPAQIIAPWEHGHGETKAYLPMAGISAVAATQQYRRGSGTSDTQYASRRQIGGVSVVAPIQASRRRWQSSGAATHLRQCDRLGA